MFQETTLIKDQRLHVRFNFREWKFLISNAAKTYGIKDFLEVYIIDHLNDEFFIYVPNDNDATNRTIINIIINLNLPILGQEPAPIQTALLYKHLQTIMLYRLLTITNNKHQLLLIIIF